ncbi:hypothetical protein MRX96_025903 [Rhipicephalus microplus]
MAASTKTGYDPSTMQWVDIEVAETREDPIPGEDEYLRITVRQMQEKLAKMKPRGSTAAAQPQARKTGSTPAACVESPRQLATWKPTHTPRRRSDELVIVLKPKITMDLHAAFQPRRDWHSSATLHRQHHERWYLRVAGVGPKHRCCRCENGKPGLEAHRGHHADDRGPPGTISRTLEISRRNLQGCRHRRRQ